MLLPKKYFAFISCPGGNRCLLHESGPHDENMRSCVAYGKMAELGLLLTLITVGHAQDCKWGYFSEVCGKACVYVSVPISV